MTREEYVKILERALLKLNKEIDMKILSGQKYSNEAREHKILLQQIRRHYRKNFFRKILLISRALTFQY